MNTDLSIEDLKVIKVALSSTPLNKAVITAINNVDALLAAHNIKAEWVALPKKPYQRQPQGEYQFVNIA